MLNFTIPTNLNGSELLDELIAGGVNIAPKYDAVLIQDGSLWLDIAQADKAKATSIVAAHNGTTVAPELTVEQKLASVGLSLDDLKTALGLA
jgi:hypothetical protein